MCKLTDIGKLIDYMVVYFDECSKFGFTLKNEVEILVEKNKSVANELKQFFENE